MVQKQFYHGSIISRLLIFLLCLIFMSLVFPAIVKADLITADSTATSITLNWTAPGDDDDQGTASQYDIRYSTSTITEANWDAATQALDEPSPQPAGSAESFLVDNLQPATTYYFAIKSADEAPNWSAMSNVAVKSTANENVPPSPIANLQAANPTGSSVILSWTAPGDDSSQGTAAAYDIRYATFAITEANWDSASQVSGEPAPQPAGSQQSHTVTGLNSNTTYYFAIKTADEVPNWSGLSNVVTATTLDITPPAAIIDLSSIRGTEAGEIVIYWTAPGDDSLAGMAGGYDIRVSIAMITDDNWESLTVVSGPPTPQGAGSPQYMTVAGLEPAQLYYIGIKSFDESGNLSDLSNIDTCTAMFSFGSDIDNRLAGLPTEFQLAQNYPNPFNPSTTIEFALPQGSHVSLEIYNSLGQKAVTLAEGFYNAGFYSIHWDGKDQYGRYVSSGMYFYRIDAGDFSEIKKMALLK
jgi:hypothetical protein